MKESSVPREGQDARFLRVNVMVIESRPDNNDVVINGRHPKMQ